MDEIVQRIVCAQVSMSPLHVIALMGRATASQVTQETLVIKVKLHFSVFFQHMLHLSNLIMNQNVQKVRMAKTVKKNVSAKMGHHVIPSLENAHVHLDGWEKDVTEVSTVEPPKKGHVENNINYIIVLCREFVLSWVVVNL